MQKVEALIANEILEGRYVVVNNPPPIISALGAVPKGDGGLRLIHDGSRPSGAALNDYAVLESQKFQSLDDAVSLLSPHAFLAKVDLKSAYRAVRIHRDDWPACGLKWTFSQDRSPTFLVDTCLPFGSRLAPGIFNRLTQAVRRGMAQRGFNIVAYLDDFLLVEPSFDRCLLALNTLLGLLRELGFSIAWHKVVGPCQQLVFLGVSIDSVAGCLELPPDKLSEFHNIVKHTMSLKRISLRDLQVLAGKLNWAAGVVRGGRTYLRRILDAMKPLKASRHKIKVSPDLREDLLWWDNFLHTFNGKYWTHKSHDWAHVFVDASTTGGGMVWGSQWTYIHWQSDCPDLADKHINIKEAAMIALAVRRWAPQWAGCNVVVHTDNTTALSALNKGSCRSPTVMCFIREVFWVSSIYCITIRGVHVPGALNVCADAVSRLHQPGSMTRLEACLGEASHIYLLLWPFFISLHMSHKALLSVFPQIHRWARSRIGCSC